MNERYVVANGIRIFCVEAGEGPLVLLLHGFPEFSYSWRHQMQPIADAGFRAVAIDLPGYARSDKPDATYDAHFVGDCISGVITALGYEKAVVAGHDWGAWVMWPFARRYPDQIAGLIGISVPDLPRYDMPPTELFKALGSKRVNYMLEFQDRSIEERIYKDLEGFLSLFYRETATVQKDVFDDETFRTYVDVFRPDGALTPPLQYYRNIDRNWELAADYDDQKIEVSTLMINSDGDPVLHPKLADGMEERVPQLEKIVVTDCGHWVQQEQPEETTKHMVAFLERLGSG